MTDEIPAELLEMRHSIDNIDAALVHLLAERFKLVAHNDKAPMPAWALTAGKHQGLKQSESEGEGRCKFVDSSGPGNGVSGASR